MDNVNGDIMGLVSGVRARFKVTLLVRCTVKRGLRLELGAGSNVRVMARLKFRVMVKCG